MLSRAQSRASTKCSSALTPVAQLRSQQLSPTRRITGLRSAPASVFTLQNGRSRSEGLLSATQRRFLAHAAPSQRRPLPSKILIANRGEIACRVIRTCRRLGIQTVAVYSEADANAAHVALADEAYCVGPAQSSDSYLCMDRIIQVMKETGAEMVHPGYGFLSENSDFAEALASAGLIFIGPPTSAIIVMGSKSASKDIMTRAGVPCVPGYHGPDQSEERLYKEAEKVGYPVLIKAVKGGGGKGMKIAENEKEFLEQLQSARREAQKSFGDTEVLIERYLQRPRHVEVQVVSSGPPYNEHVAISTRDCSVQRRHQKIIEEAPAPHLSPELEKDLCDKATAAARAVGYQGAGTIEFIMDADSGDFFFMEMNVRLQVEHPVSEMVSGIDLVEWQLEVAAGNPLPLRQDQIPSQGHSFEARIYAEDTNANFLPDVGTLSYASFPTPTTTLLSSANIDTPTSVRVDTGFSSGDEISVHYDPMIAKVIVHGRDRKEALRLMRKALDDTNIVGPKTNVEFLTQLCRHEAFIDGSGLETGFIAKYKDDLIPDRKEAPAIVFAHAALFLALQRQKDTAAASAWDSPSFSSFRLSPAQPYKHFFMLRQRQREEGDPVAVSVTPNAEGRNNHFTVSIPGHPNQLFKATLHRDGVTVASTTLVQDGTFPTPSHRFKIVKREPAASGSAIVLSRLDAFMKGERFEFDQVGPAWLEEFKGSSVAAKGSVIAPMPSKVVEIRVKVGQKVNEGDIVVVLEAMKTEHTLRAPKSGIIAKIAAEAGSMCAEGTALVTFEEEDE
ncbi:hypothetical protein CBS101457_006737 [Exobasidium rhododendri]|nr:hypothetical protein CBS101457_006737 [Exobasidium rhododendri]